jgi:hypothetical protein
MQVSQVKGCKGSVQMTQIRGRGEDSTRVNQVEIFSGASFKLE